MSFLAPLHPPFWALDGHSQTIIGHLQKDKIKFHDYQIKKFTTIDGDELLCKVHMQDPKRWVVLCHGLAGSSESNYILRLCRNLIEQNISVIRFNHRNCGEGFGLANQPYHSGRGEDLYVVIKDLNTSYPDAQVQVVGFSLSGNVVLDMLERFEDQLQIKLALTVNAPIDLKSSSEMMSSKKNSLYGCYFVNELLLFNKKMFQAQKFLSKKNVKLMSRSSMFEYDDKFTAPLAGYKNALEYYQACSTYKRLHKIQTPSLLLTAESDPFIPVKVYEELKVPSHIHVHIEKHGGHMGYLSKISLGPMFKYRWMDAFLVRQILQGYQ